MKFGVSRRYHGYVGRISHLYKNITQYPFSRKFSVDAEPLVPALKLSTNRTVLCSRGTVVPPDCNYMIFKAFVTMIVNVYECDLKNSPILRLLFRWNGHEWNLPLAEWKSHNWTVFSVSRKMYASLETFLSFNISVNTANFWYFFWHRNDKQVVATFYHVFNFSTRKRISRF